ncbi:MAG: phosphate/phosphite/phosphonate ABC transporter substrate-binding protein [Desulfobacteraceae bacterium]|nr:phosphate/phosphite/phosphonate ABC transporter substrate-binding protein [Desulfobacteraceae bacterium]
MCVRDSNVMLGRGGRMVIRLGKGIQECSGYSLAVLLLLFVLGSSMATTSYAEETVYTFGVVPQFDARHVYSVWRPILDLVEQRAGIKLQLKGSSNIPAFQEQFVAGQFDFAYMDPYHLIKARNRQAYHPLVRDVGRSLYGIIVVRKDSPIREVSELDGKVVAFPAPNSLGASLLTRAIFHNEYHIVIDPRYVQSHSSVYLNVIFGQAAAGGGVQKTLAQQEQKIRDGLRVLYRTRDVTPHPVAVHPRVPKKVQQAVRDALLALGRDGPGQILLAKVPIENIGIASYEDYRPLEKMGLEHFYRSDLEK